MAHRKSLQVIMSAPARVLVGSYTTKSGQVKNRYAPKEEIYNDDEPFLKFMTNSLPAKEHSIDLRKNVLDTSYDRRLLL